MPELELALREDKLGPHIRWLTLVRPKVVIYRSRFHDADANDKARRNQAENGTGYVKAGPWGSTIQLRGGLSLSGSSTNANRVKPV